MGLFSHKLLALQGPTQPPKLKGGDFRNMPLLSGAGALGAGASGDGRGAVQGQRAQPGGQHHKKFGLQRSVTPWRTQACTMAARDVRPNSSASFTASVTAPVPAEEQRSAEEGLVVSLEGRPIAAHRLRHSFPGRLNRHTRHVRHLGVGVRKDTADSLLLDGGRKMLFLWIQAQKLMFSRRADVLRADGGPPSTQVPKTSFYDKIENRKSSDEPCVIAAVARGKGLLGGRGRGQRPSCRRRASLGS